jgi:5-methylcytosine-specific restriction endonuclease McrA
MSELTKSSGAERARLWREANPERARLGCRLHHAANAEAIRERKRRYYQEVRKLKDQTDLGRFKDRDRKARRRAAVATDRVTAEEWTAICAAHDHRCAYCCCRPDVLEMDHVLPLTKGGRHLASNIVPACKPCNSAKGNR